MALRDVWHRVGSIPAREPLHYHCRKSILTLLSVLAFSSASLAQTRHQSGAETSQTKTESFDPHDLSGVWTIRQKPLLYGFGEQTPPMTTWGQAKFDAAKPGMGPRGAPLGNDPLLVCDPVGFPRILFYDALPIEIIQIRGRVLQFYDYWRTWRTIWTDGRALPKNPEPRWLGYSVGKWAQDTFVVDSVGFDERTWIDNWGNPHSGSMRLEERYRRVDHNTVEVNMTLTDPKTYTKPFVMSTRILRLAPKMELGEDFCVPSEEEKYKQEMREPAGGVRSKQP
jgi:hypothetical protein